MVGSHGLTERLECYVIHDTSYLTYIHAQELYISTLKDSNFKVHIHNFIKSHNRVHDSNYPIVANTCTPREKGSKWRE